MYDRLERSQIRRSYKGSSLFRALARETIPYWKQIVLEVLNETGVQPDDIFSPKRTRHVAHARQECFLRIRDRTSMSLPAIGRLFHRDHTTVLQGIRAAEARRSLRLAE